MGGQFRRRHDHFGGRLHAGRRDPGHGGRDRTAGQWSGGGHGRVHRFARSGSDDLQQDHDASRGRDARFQHSQRGQRLRHAGLPRQGGQHRHDHRGGRLHTAQRDGQHVGHGGAAGRRRGHRQRHVLRDPVFHRHDIEQDHDARRGRHPRLRGHGSFAGRYRELARSHGRRRDHRGGRLHAGRRDGQHARARRAGGGRSGRGHRRFHDQRGAYADPAQAVRLPGRRRDAGAAFAGEPAFGRRRSDRMERRRHRGLDDRARLPDIARHHDAGRGVPVRRERLGVRPGGAAREAGADGGLHAVRLHHRDGAADAADEHGRDVSGGRAGHEPRRIGASARVPHPPDGHDAAFGVRLGLLVGMGPGRGQPAASARAHRGRAAARLPAGGEARRLRPAGQPRGGLSGQLAGRASGPDGRGRRVADRPRAFAPAGRVRVGDALGVGPGSGRPAVRAAGLRHRP